jgi:hypothetical protein
MCLDLCYYCSFPRRSKGSCITQWKMAISYFIISRKNWNYQDWNLFCSRKLVKSSCIPCYWSSLWTGDPKALELHKERRNNFSFSNILRKLEPLGLNLLSWKKLVIFMDIRPTIKSTRSKIWDFSHPSYDFL